jgi:anti-sigma factor RsiW
MSADTSGPKRRCAHLVGLLADYVEHQLPSDVHDELERHLARCPQCVAQLKTYESTVSLLHSIRDEDLPQELRCKLKTFFTRNCRN